MMRSRVDLPQPEGPTMVIKLTDIGQVFDDEADVLQGELGLGAVAEALADVLEGHHVRAAASGVVLRCAAAGAGPRGLSGLRAPGRTAGA